MTNRSGSAAVVLGLAIDAAFGEPPAAWHPVARFGQAATWLEQHTYRPTVRAGAVHWAVAVGSAVGVGVALQSLTGRRAAVGLAAGVSIAGRMLSREAAAVESALVAGELDEARRRVARIVGRDVSDLDVADVARAAIETVAENTVDAVVASLWWGWIAGAPGVLAHRAVNTLDAMVGHRTARYERFGRLAARADDVANWVPARLAAAAVIVVRPTRATEVLRTIRRDAAAHPSPNGGIIESAVAGALDVRLGGVNRYGVVVDDRGSLGSGRPPHPSDIGRSIALMRDATGAIAVAMLATNAIRCRSWR